MKLRNGFVSNSSSSSFIIGKDNIEKAKEIIEQDGYYDYYELEDKLYTSFISDCSDCFSLLSDLSEGSIDGSSNSPYDEDSCFEFEGDRGIDPVFIEKFRCKDKFKAEQDIKDSLYKYVRNYIECNTISCIEMIHQNDEVLTDAPYFLQNCCEIVGYEGDYDEN